MDELKERWKVWRGSPTRSGALDGKGFFLSDDIGTRFIEKARALGVKVICVHKGLPFGKQSYEHSQCSDIGVVAKRFPDVSFLVYHSGFVTGVPERAYSGRGASDGIDTLIRSLVENGVKPNSNVYAELGSTWRFLMREPDERGARARQAPQVLRREQCALGHRLHLVRIASRSDPGVSHFPDRVPNCARCMAIPRSRRRCARRFSA